MHKFHFYSIFKSNPMENFVEKIIGVSEGLAGENLAIAALARKAYDGPYTASLPALERI